MSYKVDTIAPFRKEAKKLIKKILLLKMNWPNSAANFPLTLPPVLISAIIATRYAWPFLQKEKANPGAQG